MSKLTKYLDTKFYNEYSDNWDDTLFRSVILDHIRENHVCLDYGCGRGNVKQMNFIGQAKFIAGVDPDSEVFNNKFINEAKILNIETNVIDYPNDTFDIVFSDNVMEHIKDSDAVLTEINRVLKPGGILLFKTPNKYHYMPLIARFTPTWFHRYYNKLRGRESVDTFPTIYQLNTKTDIKRFSDNTGFRVDNITLIEGRPEYLRLTFLTYLFGLAYERFVNSSASLELFRCVIIAKLEKKQLNTVHPQLA